MQLSPAEFFGQQLLPSGRTVRLPIKNHWLVVSPAKVDGAGIAVPRADNLPTRLMRRYWPDTAGPHAGQSVDPARMVRVLGLEGNSVMRDGVSADRASTASRSRPPTRKSKTDARERD